MFQLEPARSVLLVDDEETSPYVTRQMRGGCGPLLIMEAEGVRLAQPLRPGVVLRPVTDRLPRTHQRNRPNQAQAVQPALTRETIHRALADMWPAALPPERPLGVNGV